MSENLYTDLERLENDSESASNLSLPQSQAVNANSELNSFLKNAFENEFVDSPAPAPAASVYSDSSDDDDEHDNKPHVEIIFPVTSFKRRIRECEIINHGYKNIVLFLLRAFDFYEPAIFELVLEFNLIKSLSYFIAEFERAFIRDEYSDPVFEKRTVYIPTVVKDIDFNTNLRRHFRRDVIMHVMNQIEEVMIEGSGFTLSKIIKLHVQIFKNDPLRASGYIPLPNALKNCVKSIINLKNTEEKCFQWSILAALHYDEVHKRNRNKATDATRYKEWAKTLNFDCIDTPTPLTQIETFMQHNESARIAVNIYFYDSGKKRICPLLISNRPLDYQHVNLLYLRKRIRRFDAEDDDDDCFDSHYCWIRNLAALVRSQVTKNTKKIFLCNRCLNHFRTAVKLTEHNKMCTIKNKCAIEMPDLKSNVVRFKNFQNELKYPFVIYADTESLLKPPGKSVFSPNCKTQAIQQHEIHSIGYYFLDANEEIKSYYASHRGSNCVDWFMNELTNIAMDAFDFLETKRSMIALTQKQEKAFHSATVCHICKERFIANRTDKTHCKVRDHCHLSGQYRGPAHSICNLNYQVSRFIPVMMHNLCGYDLHLLIKNIANTQPIDGAVKIIPHNTEKYITFIKTMRGVGRRSENRKYVNEIKFKFIDSLRFMNASLDSLARSLQPENKRILKKECLKMGYSHEMFTLLNRKGVFPL